ncbi:MAG: hypothetical protein U5K79_19140 [Cyclobacteriaceae bacterium]|nr:hypothetical protein [Cyclobacteriaceae bacterium]
MIISNWGNYPKVDADVSSPTYIIEDLKHLIAQPNSFICRGKREVLWPMCRWIVIYISMLDYAKFIRFDQAAGMLACQAGVLLSEILDVIVPKGFFLPVTPGTKFVRSVGP